MRTVARARTYARASDCARPRIRARMGAQLTESSRFMAPSHTAPSPGGQEEARGDGGAQRPGRERRDHGALREPVPQFPLHRLRPPARAPGPLHKGADGRSDLPRRSSTLKKNQEKDGWGQCQSARQFYLLHLYHLYFPFFRTQIRGEKEVDGSHQKSVIWWFFKFAKLKSLNLLHRI